MTNALLERAKLEIRAEDKAKEMLYRKDEGAFDIGDDLEKGEGRKTVTSTNVQIPFWNRETGVKSLIASDQLKQRIRQKFPVGHPMAGQQVFTDVPMEDALKERWTCQLHKDHEARETFVTLGFIQTCLKNNIPPNIRDLDLHMERKHNSAFKARKEHEQRRREDMQMELLKQQTEAMQAMARGQGNQGVYAAVVPPELQGRVDELQARAEVLDQAWVDEGLGTRCERCAWKSKPGTKNPERAKLLHIGAMHKDAA